MFTIWINKDDNFLRKIDASTGSPRVVVVVVVVVIIIKVMDPQLQYCKSKRWVIIIEAGSENQSVKSLSVASPATRVIINLAL